MARTNGQNHLNKDIRRQKIMDKALSVFAEKGYKKTSTDDITARAKCSHGLFYHYFTDKDDVFIAIENEARDKKREPYIINWNDIKEKGGYDGLMMLTDTLAKILKGPNEIVEYWLVLSRDNFSLQYIPTVENREEDKAILLSLITKGQEEGKVRSGDPSQILQTMVDFMVGALKRRVSKHSQKFIIYEKEDIAHMFTK